MKISYYLDKPKDTKETAIYLIAKIDGENHKFNTKWKVLPKNWSQVKNKAKSGSNKDDLNHFLKTKLIEVESIFLEMQRDSSLIDIDEFRKRAKAVFGKVTSKAGNKDFWYCYDEFIRNGRLKKQATTIRTYQTLKNHLKDFEKRKNFRLSFERINLEFKDRFYQYLLEVPQLSDSSIHKNFQILKAFMTFSAQREYHDNFMYKLFSFKREPQKKVALTKEELVKIRALDLSGSEKLAKVRDMFLFQCLTSLRWSDLKNLQKVNIHDDTNNDGKPIKVIRLKAQKTRGDIWVPIPKEGVDLLRKYEEVNGNYCFPNISSQKYNDYIKEACKLAGIDDPIQIVRFSGNKREEREVPKYEEIASHTGRRTFITLFVEDGYTMEQCMVITGHKNVKELKTYWQRSSRGNLNILGGLLKSAQY